MGAMEDAGFFLKTMRECFMKKVQVGNGVRQLMTITRDQAGNCFFCLRELRTTVTELPAMAAAASSGLIQPIIASGMVMVL